MSGAATTLRPPAEAGFLGELATLAADDSGPRLAGWRLSPRDVCAFLLGGYKGGMRRTVNGGAG